jgi:uncharacterized protein YndB with AHSA1/START domain
MNEFHGAATRRMAANPEAVFDLVTDLDRLPEWNATVDQITERPASLAVGAEWVAVMHPRRSPSWKSRSTVEDIDRDRRCFVYKSRNEDGNPSYARWTWEVVPAGHAAGGDRPLGRLPQDARPEVDRGAHPTTRTGTRGARLTRCLGNRAAHPLTPCVTGDPRRPGRHAHAARSSRHSRASANPTKGRTEFRGHNGARGVARCRPGKRLRGAHDPRRLGRLVGQGGDRRTAGLARSSSSITGWVRPCGCRSPTLFPMSGSRGNASPSSPIQVIRRRNGRAKPCSST